MIITITDVQLPDSCVRLVRHDGPVSWAEARDSCVRLGGMMARLRRAQHWLYVSRALRTPLQERVLSMFRFTWGC